MSSRQLTVEPIVSEPADAPRQLVYLAASEGRAERKLIDRWLAEKGVGGALGSAQAIHYDKPRATPASAQLVDALCGNDNLSEIAWLAPVRVIWRAPKRTGHHIPRWRDALLMRNPRDPSERAKARLAMSDSDRWTIIEGEPARLGDLRLRWQVKANDEDIAAPREFARFVARQAELALERAEYRVRGARYKVPRVYKEDVAGSPGFRRGIAGLATDLGRDEASVRAEALGCLDELRTAHDPFVLDLAAKAFHKMYSAGYGEVDVESAQIEMLREAFAKHPVLLLPSHKTNLDSPVVESVLALHNLPPPTLFAGINMSFWPMGPLMRRAGRVFLRRKISDNPVYKFALREWLGYLIERRFNLEWFPEGTRSRTGKLLPPKVGLLSYAADAYRQGHVEDLMLVPIAIIYDQTSEVAGYAREALGETKKAENLAWMLKGIREMGAPQGKVYLRIGEPLSMRAALGPPDPLADADSDENRLALQKLSLAVAWRTNQVTPITGIAIVTFALLAAGQRAVTMDRIIPYVRLLVRQARDRDQPLTQSAMLDTPEQIVEVLDELTRTNVVTPNHQGIEPVYSIAEGQHLAAAFYRNSMLHFVLDRAIGEVALLTAGEAPRGSREVSFREAALRLREALKFEFFFRERPAFDDRLEEELNRINPDWRRLLEEGDDPVAIHRSIFRLGVAHAVLRPFIEAYYVVAEVLQRESADTAFDERAFLDKCQKLGRQYLLQRELRNPESVSRQLFTTGVQLVRNLNLTEPGPGVAAQRAEFAKRLREVLERVDTAEDTSGREQTRTS
ncbi:MAG: glycerol-3-phosphate 1-O-acyltransferase [Novosphingobium sp.]